jgi:hypothetical protein
MEILRAGSYMAIEFLKAEQRSTYSSKDVYAVFACIVRSTLNSDPFVLCVMRLCVTQNNINAVFLLAFPIFHS